jgi:cell division protein FtsW (lipid II flippase)
MEKFVLGLIVLAGMFGLALLFDKSGEDAKKGRFFLRNFVWIVIALIILYALVRGWNR